MNCKECQERIVAYSLKELTRAEQDELEKHLSDCKDCQQVLKQTKGILAAMDQSPAIEPAAGIRAAFLDKLNEEKTVINGQKTKLTLPGPPIYRVAAAITLLVVGFSAGRSVNLTVTNDSEMAELKSEVQSMKQLVMMSMLRDESASERIQAVSHIEEFNEPSPEVIQTLFNTLNKDESPNVRLAAVRALEKFTNHEAVRLMLIKSMEFQNDPVVQIALINLMVDLEEKRAARKFKQLINDPETQKIVKDQAQIAIRILT